MSQISRATGSLSRVLVLCGTLLALTAGEAESAASPSATAAEAAAAPPADSLTLRLRAHKTLRYPQAAAIPQEEWQAAVVGAVGNGIATLLARQQVGSNTTGLLVPPTETRKVESYEEKDVPHAKKMVKEPIFEWKEVMQLVPKKDANGYVVGTELKAVKVPGKITGYKEVEKLVPDPAGTVMVKMRRPIYAPGGPALYYKGIFGLNGMALHILARAGMAGSSEATRQADALEQLIAEVGLPDSTFDLAWLAVGLAQTPGSDTRAELVQRIASRLLDGQIRDGAGAGLWGPVSISAQQLAACLDQFYRLSAEIDKLDAQLQAGGRTQAAKLQNDRNKLSSQRQAIKDIVRDFSSQGLRLTSITRIWNPDGEANAKDATRELAGLPYYVYNRQVGGIEDTALALMALAELQRAGLLPAGARRPALEGRKLAPALTTAAVIALAAKAVGAAQLADGTWTATCTSQIGKAFDQVKALQIPDVPFTAEHPPLLNPRTMQTTLAGAAALRALQLLDATAVKSEQLAKATAAVAVGLQGWCASGSQPKTEERWYTLVSIDNATLQARKGWLLPPPAPPAKGGKAPVAPPDPLTRIGADLPLEQTSLGGMGVPPALASSLMPWYQQPAWSPEQYRLLTYRLMVTQSEQGQWQTQGNPCITTTEVALNMEREAQQHLVRLERRGPVAEPGAKAEGGKPEGGKKDKPAKGKEGAEARGQKLRMPVFEPFCSCSTEAASTVLNLSVLVEGLQAPISLEGITILPPAGTEAGSPDDAVALVARPNPALLALLTAMGAPPVSGPLPAAEPEPEPAAEPTPVAPTE